MSCQPDCSFFFTLLLKRDKRNCTKWKRGTGKSFSWKEDHLLLFMFKYIMLNPNFHLLPFFLRVTTQNTSFFHMNKPWTTGARLTNWNRREIESGNHYSLLLWYCTQISISNQEFLSIMNYVSSLPYKGCNSNWQLYKTFTSKVVNLSGSVLEEFACS